MRVLFINSVCGIRSTGRICADLSRELEAQGHECKIAYGRMEEVPELAPVIYSAADVNVIPLEKEIYKTALPSKTATCLACQKPIIFAIGKESKFGHLAAVKTACPAVDSDSPEELVKAIRNIQGKKIQCVTAEFYLNNFALSKNSARYAEVITEGDIHQ